MPVERNGLEIRAELLRRGMTLPHVAAEAGVSRPLVSRTVNGLSNNRRVLRALLALGVPASLLNLPIDMRRAAAA